MYVHVSVKQTNPSTSLTSALRALHYKSAVNNITNFSPNVAKNGAWRLKSRNVGFLRFSEVKCLLLRKVVGYLVID